MLAQGTEGKIKYRHKNIIQESLLQEIEAR